MKTNISKATLHFLLIIASVLLSDSLIAQVSNAPKTEYEKLCTDTLDIEVIKYYGGGSYGWCMTEYSIIIALFQQDTLCFKAGNMHFLEPGTEAKIFATSVIPEKTLDSPVPYLLPVHYYNGEFANTKIYEPTNLHFVKLKNTLNLQVMEAANGKSLTHYDLTILPCYEDDSIDLKVDSTEIVSYNLDLMCYYEITISKEGYDTLNMEIHNSSEFSEVQLDAYVFKSNPSKTEKRKSIRFLKKISKQPIPSAERTLFVRYGID